MKLYGGIVLGFAIAYTFLIVNDLHETDQVRSWPTAPGLILKAEHGKPNRFSNSDYTITYEYPVNGQMFTAHEYRIWGPTKADFEKQHVGAQVSVHYNPQSPSTAFIEAELNPEALPKHILVNIATYILAIVLWVVKRAPRAQE